MKRIKPFNECKRRSVDSEHIYLVNTHAGIYRVSQAVKEVRKMIRKINGADKEYTAALHTAMDVVYALGIKKHKAVTRGAYLSLVRALLIYSLCMEVGIDKTLIYLESTNYARMRGVIGGNLRYINADGEREIALSGPISYIDS
mgnify:CR=1 FL=1